MAQSAREASLLEQRRIDSALRRYSSGGRRTVPPNSLAASVQTIARRNLEAEIQATQKKYADGLISNEEMKAFLERQKDSPILSASEKVQMDDTLRGLDIKIRTSKLETAYKLAPENSMQKVQAAQALSNYYSTYAGTLIPDTPAHSEALSAAGQWANAAASDQNQMEKSQRTLLRAQTLNEISYLDTNSVAGLQEKAKKFQELANEARQDGAESEALNYETQAQNVLNAVPTLNTKLSKKEVVDTMNNLANDYHDGRITATQYFQNLTAIGSKVDEIGDTSLALTYNRVVDSTQKIINREREANVTKDWDKQDFDYSDNLRIAHEMLSSGKWDATKYQQAVSMAIQERSQQLGERYQTLYEIAQSNPNARVKYNGRAVRAADALDNVNQENDDLSGQVEAINSGQFGLAEIPPDQFNNNGSIKKSGKSQVTYKFVDLRNVPADQYAQDESGVLHQISRKPIEIGLDEYQTGVIENPAAYSYDKTSGKYFKLDNPSVDLYEPGTANKTSTPYQKGQVLKPFTNKENGPFAPGQYTYGPQINVPEKTEATPTPPANIKNPVDPKPPISPTPTPVASVNPTIQPSPMSVKTTPAPTVNPASISPVKSPSLSTRINLAPMETTPAPSAQLKPQTNIIQSSMDWLKNKAAGVKNYLSTKIFGG